MYESAQGARLMVDGVVMIGGGGVFAPVSGGSSAVAGTVVGGLEIAAGTALAGLGTAVIVGSGRNFADSIQKIMKSTDDSQIDRGNINSGNGVRNEVVSNTGEVIDTTPSVNHSTVTENPGYRGAANSSVDILDKTGTLETRRWYGSDGKAVRDVDFTNHGNPSTHPQWPHEHFWKYGVDGKPIGR